ncbi:hypothetical protein V1478_009018 [Vespula squamosa]|uniref:Uncharacterized protein n=1 Tax=Vespula squamosa TaxID=30214 RepID=A0ABD2AXU2_VESSQ
MTRISYCARVKFMIIHNLSFNFKLTMLKILLNIVIYIYKGIEELICFDIYCSIIVTANGCDNDMILNYFEFL